MVNRIFATAILSLLNLFMLDTMPHWGIQWVSKKWNFPKLPFPLSIWWPRPCSSPSCHSKPPSLRSYFRRYYFQPSHTTSFSFGRWYPFIYESHTHSQIPKLSWFQTTSPTCYQTFSPKCLKSIPILPKKNLSWIFLIITQLSKSDTESHSFLSPFTLATFMQIID